MNKTIFENENFRLLHSEECAVPGYLVLWPKPSIESIVHLADPVATQLGDMLRRATAAINDVVNPERVYVICLSELEPRIHFHLFPRTQPTTDAFRHATGYHEKAINGLVYMQWVRSNLRLQTEAEQQEILETIMALSKRMTRDC